MKSSLQSRMFEIRVLPIEQLQPAAYNPRRVLRPTDKAYRKLERSLREFGLVEPLVWNESTGRVVGGHARLSILKSMGVTEVPVSVVRLSEAREKALNVMLNNQEAQGRYDPSRLADLLDELNDMPELELTGFDSNALPPLRLQALPGPVEEPATNRMTVTLEMSPETFEEITPRLDALIADFDLVCHIQRK